MTYRITAHVYNRPAPGGYTFATHLPTFFLDSDVQGIVNAEHAAAIARSMLELLVTDGGTVAVEAIDEETRSDYAHAEGEVTHG